MSENSIRFPGLHIDLPYVGEHIDIFGFSIAYYGIIIACGMLLAGAFILREGKRRGFSEDDLLDITLWGIVCGVIGARIYYVIFSWDYYRDDPLRIFFLREGGLGIYGGIIAGLITVIVLCKRKWLDFFAVADVVIFGVLIGQICGRWGNFFNREAFGDYFDGLFAMQIPLASVRQADAVTQRISNHLIHYEGMEWISVHPTFLYESLWNLGVLLILYFAVRKYKKSEGEIFFSYLALYGGGRLWIEALRTDSLMLMYTGIPVSEIVAGICVVVGIGGIYYRRNSGTL